MASLSKYGHKLQLPQWQIKRMEIMNRDLYKCQKCFRGVGELKDSLSVHHRHYIPGREPWDYPGELLITLCNDCHKKEEDCAKIGQELVNTLHFWGFFNTEIQDELNRLIDQKMETRKTNPSYTSNAQQDASRLDK